jgi:hypothetical protein
MGMLLVEMEILHRKGPARPGGERVLIAGDRALSVMAISCSLDES